MAATAIVVDEGSSPRRIHGSFSCPTGVCCARAAVALVGRKVEVQDALRMWAIGVCMAVQPAAAAAPARALIHFIGGSVCTRHAHLPPASADRSACFALR